MENSKIKTNKEPLKAIQEFENMIKDAELRALRKTALERQLEPHEFKRFKELAHKKLGIKNGN